MLKLSHYITKEPIVATCNSIKKDVIKTNFEVVSIKALASIQDLDIMECF